MATVNPIQVYASGDDNRDGWKVTWPNMQQGDVGGSPSNVVGFADHSVQVEGTFGAGGSITILGTLDGANFRQLTDPQGVLLNITSAAIKQVTEATVNMIPIVSGGDGTTSLTVTAIFRRTKT